MDNKKILILALLGAVAVFMIMRSKKTETETYSKAEGLSSALGGLTSQTLGASGQFSTQLNDMMQTAIDNATEQVTTMGDNIARWSTHRYNNAMDHMLW